MARELVSIKPIKELAEMRTDVDRLMDALFYGKPKIGNVEEQRFHPVDIGETKDDIVVKAEIPGLDPEDLEISLSGLLLTIKGEKKEEREGKEENYHLRERVYGSFTRLINLPTQVDSDKVKASYTDGILTVTLPKAKEVKKKEIKIKAE